MSGKNKGIRKGASFSLIHKLCEYQAVRKLAETKGYPVRQMCRCLGIRRSAYYHWLRYPKSERERKNEQIVDLIKEIHHLHPDMGYRRIRDELAVNYEMPFNDKRILRICRKIISLISGLTFSLYRILSNALRCLSRAISAILILIEISPEESILE